MRINIQKGGRTVKSFSVRELPVKPKRKKRKQSTSRIHNLPQPRRKPKRRSDGIEYDFEGGLTVTE